ncbi:MAG: alpha-D-ribose 1-methylphosphonate 5-triphosphate diphosphatase [Minwuia sp.]|uniref:alpha-D-ribose 1-methylphosphonate 5-triphosphate diphosphatase n=1 Tax=Minwuia sp. TaxID=2493630 RepID=UPI003A83A46D
MADWVIRGGRVLMGGEIVRTSVTVDGCRIADEGKASRHIDAEGLLVLPGIVDIHGDGFERQIMPRQGVGFGLPLALVETDRQLIANGITTAFHGLTVSWEPGLRSIENAQAFVDALQATRPLLACDTRLHLRWETFALDAVDLVAGWFDLEPPPILAFNDHTTLTVQALRPGNKLEQWASRAGVTSDAYVELVNDVWSRREEVPAAISKLAERAREKGLVLLAHDERSPAEREQFRAMGAITSEFPMTPETAAAAREAGEHTVLGAPNVLRGGSHTGALNAADSVGEGLCTVLASDYFYPAQLQAAFRLAAEGVASLEAAWPLVSANAAAAAGLPDRGVIEPGKRADLILVDDSDPALPRVRAVFVAGRKVYEAA